MKTEVLTRGPARFNMVGQMLGYSLKDTGESISPGLARRLLSYATSRAEERGLSAIIKDSEIAVVTLDGDQKPSERKYDVVWTNPQGLSIELTRIETRNGWPFLDYGFSISEDKP